MLFSFFAFIIIIIQLETRESVLLEDVAVHKDNYFTVKIAFLNLQQVNDDDEDDDDDDYAVFFFCSTSSSSLKYDLPGIPCVSAMFVIFLFSFLFFFFLMYFYHRCVYPYLCLYLYRISVLSLSHLSCIGNE